MVLGGKHFTGTRPVAFEPRDLQGEYTRRFPVIANFKHDP
jgi:hypothetical protein